MLLRPLSSDSLLPDSDSLSAPIAKNPGSSGTITGIPGHAVVLKLVRKTRLKPTVASSARRPKSIATLGAADVALGKRGDGPMARTVAGGRASTTYRVAVPSLPFFFARVAFVCALLIAASGRRRPEGSERLKPAVSHGDIGKDATPRSKCRKWGRRSQLGRGTSAMKCVTRRLVKYPITYPKALDPGQNISCARGWRECDTNIHALDHPLPYE